MNNFQPHCVGLNRHGVLTTCGNLVPRTVSTEEASQGTIRGGGQNVRQDSGEEGVIGGRRREGQAPIVQLEEGADRPRREEGARGLLPGDQVFHLLRYFINLI
jgi:hypothetical protein